MTTTDIRASQCSREAQAPPAGADQTNPPAITGQKPKDAPPAGSNLYADQKAPENQPAHVGVDQINPSTKHRTEPKPLGSGGNGVGTGSPTTEVPQPTVASLVDPVLRVLADVREDMQSIRIANQNRLRHLTVGREPTADDDSDASYLADKDGVIRGLGLDESHPDVARLAALVDLIAQVEHKATLNLNRRMRQHPLAAWCASKKGVGTGTLPARLLSILGDPYINIATGGPRTVSQLWSYCGHGDPTRRRRKGMSQAELFALGNPDAKMVVHLIAESCMKAGGEYRDVYDKRRANTEGRAHREACVRCGPSGHPAQPGSDWSKAHANADALRIVGKEILRDMWLEARRLHEGLPSS